MKKFLSKIPRTGLPIFTICCLLLVWNHSPSNAWQGTGEEYNIKATFIFHFTKYVEWPDLESGEPFTIGVFGKSDIIVPLKEISKMKTVNNRKITVVQIDDLQQISACHILFISPLDKKELKKLLETVGSHPVLTVGDTNGFADFGVALNFVIVNGKIKFELNPCAVERAGLWVSSQLQKLAILIEEEEGI